MKKVAIIGEGISGLVFANLLKQELDYEVIIYEKNNSINLEKGYGVQLSINSVELLNKIGFQNISSKNKFYPNKVDFYSSISKKKICDLDISTFNKDSVKYTTLQRATLIDFLKNKIPSNLTQYNKRISKIKNINKNIELIFDDNSYVNCDFLILSDGVFSSTKSLIAQKDLHPKYYNSVAVRGTIDKKDFKNIDFGNISLFLGSNGHSVIYPVGADSELNFICILRKHLNKEDLNNHLLFKDKNFINSIKYDLSNHIEKNIINNLNNIKCFPIFASKEIYYPKKNNIFIIGDAFYTFPPTFAQGASQSIEAAFELYENFGMNAEEFNLKRIKKVKLINKRSKLNHFAFHLSNPFMIFFRDLLMRYLLKNKKFINNYLGKIYKTNY